MQSEKYICVRETNSVVIIDMTLTGQPIRLPITADSAIMNPDNPILAFKVEAKIDETTSQDQLRIYDVDTMTTLKSCNIAEKVEFWKWISPKLLVLITLKAVYHWSIQGLTGPGKVSDMPKELTTCKDAKITNYMLDPSEKWLALVGYWMEDTKCYSRLFVRPYQCGDQWFNFTAHAAAFITFNVEGIDAPSTLLCSALGRVRIAGNARYIELSISDGFDSQQGEPNFGKKQFKFDITDTYSYVEAVQISQKYGLIYVITACGLISLHDLETAEAICSCNIVDHITDGYQILRTTAGPSSESFYAINCKGQVLITSANDSTILSFVSDKFITREKSLNLQKIYLQIMKEKEETVTNLEKLLEAEIKKEEQWTNEYEGLKKQKEDFQIESLESKRVLKESPSKSTELANKIEQLKKENAKLQERDKIVTLMTKSLLIEMNQHTSMLTDIKNDQVSQKETLIRIEGLTKQNSELTKSLRVEQNARREIEEQLKSKMTEIDKYQKSQEEMMKKLEDFRLLKETNNLEAIFTEYSSTELKKATNNFSVSLKIGEGGYGPVYKAFIGLKPVAIKILKYESSHGYKQFTQEVEILRSIRHPNLVMLLGACREAQALVYELLPNGDLYAILRNQQKTNALTWKRRIRIASDICSALICLHSAKPHGIVHGDLKPGNILLDSNYMGKLSDFGICRHLEKIDSRDTAVHYTETLKGTRPYMDPECFSIGELTAQCDVYSFGIVLLELVTGREPMGLRIWVQDALSKGQIFMDASAGEWPLQIALKMVHLGLRCSEFSRKERPNLEKEVLTEIESMLLASLHF